MWITCTWNGFQSEECSLCMYLMIGDRCDVYVGMGSTDYLYMLVWGPRITCICMYMHLI